MEKEFIPYEQALELKGLGFDEPCFGYYDSEGLQPSDGFWWNRENKNSLFVEPEKTNNPKISAPTFPQAFRWFREKHGLLHDITLGVNNDNELESFYILIHKLNGIVINEDDDIELSVETTNKEEAELACLIKLIKIVKDGK